MRLHLRVAIGALNAVFVIFVGLVALLVTSSVSLDTLRDNGERHVRALGGAATQKIETFFYSIESVSTGMRDWVRLEPFALPSEDPTRTWNASQRAAAGNIPEGGMALERLRQAWWATMAEVKFKPLTLNVWLVDGTRLVSLPMLDIKPYMFMETMYQNEFTSPFPFAPPQLNRSIRGINPVDAKALEPGDVPAVDAFFANRLANFPVVDLRSTGVQGVLNPLTNKTFGAPAKWSPVRYFYDNGDWFYSFAMTSLYNSTKDFLGYCLCAVEVINIGKELDSVRPTKETVMFMLDDKGFVMGATEGVRVYNKTALLNKTAPIPPGCTTTEESKGAVPSTQDVIMCRHHAGNSENAVLRSLAESGGLATDGLQRVLKVGGTKYYVRVDALKSVTLEATVVVVVPESDIIGDVQRTVMIAAFSTAAVVVVAAVLSFFFVWAMLHPLVSIAVRMGKAARLEEDDEAVGDSVMAEIGNLQRAFVEMRDELSRIRAFVPQSLLKGGTEDDDEDEDDDEKTLRTAEASHSNTGGLMMSGATDFSATSDNSHSNAAQRSTPAPHSVGTPSVGTPSVISRQSKYKKQRAATQMATRSALGVRKENVSVLVINLRGYHQHANRRIDSASVAKLVDAVHTSVESERGVLDSFHGDRFFVSFNAVRTAANHGARAAIAAMRVSAAVEKLTDLSLPVSCGVGTGAAQVGNLGSKTVMRFSIIGPVVSQAAALERLCKVYTDVKCLVPQRLIEDARTSAELHPIDYVQLPFMKVPCLVAAVVAEIKRNVNQDMEWMYQLHGTGATTHNTPVQPPPIDMDAAEKSPPKTSLLPYSELMRAPDDAQVLTAEDLVRVRVAAGPGWMGLMTDDNAAVKAALREVMAIAGKADRKTLPMEIEHFLSSAQSALNGGSVSSVDQAHATPVGAKLRPNQLGVFYDRAVATCMQEQE